MLRWKHGIDTGEEAAIMSRVITISREFGSGGREVGFRLAEKLGIPFYDKEIISMAAEDTNISEEVFHRHDEVIGKKERIDHDYVSVDPFSLYEDSGIRIRYLWHSRRSLKSWLRKALA